MKLQELLEARITLHPEIVKLTNLGKGLKGVKVYKPLEKQLDDTDGQPYPEAYTVRVIYKSTRGAPVPETIYVYRTEAGDWGYLTGNENKERGELDELLIDLREYLQQVANFNAKPMAEKVELSGDRQKIADVVYGRGAGGSIRNWVTQLLDKAIMGSDAPKVRGGWLGGTDFTSKKLKNIGLNDEQIGQIRQAIVDASIAVMDWLKRRHPDAKFTKMIYKDPENFGVFQVYGSWEEGDDDKYFSELPNTQGFRNEFRGKVEELFKLKLQKLPDWVFKPVDEK